MTILVFFNRSVHQSSSERLCVSWSTACIASAASVPSIRIYTFVPSGGVSVIRSSTAFVVHFLSIVADSHIRMKRKHGAHEPRFRPDVMPPSYRDFLFQLLDSIALICHTTRRRRHVSHDRFNRSAHRLCPPRVNVFVLTRSASPLAFVKDDVFCLGMPPRHTRPRSGTTGLSEWSRNAT